MAGGLCCGLSALGAGLTIGIVGDAGVRANAQKDIYVGMILILIFAEALGLYGLIVAIILSSTSTPVSGINTDVYPPQVVTYCISGTGAS